MKWQIFALLTIILVCRARYFQTSFKFSLFGRNQGWMFVDKMTIAPGSALVEFETRTTGLAYGQNSQIFLQAISQQKWEKQQKQRCKNPIRLPLSVHHLNIDGTTSSSTIRFGTQDYKTYYFVLKDCQSRFLSEYNNTNLQLHLKLHIVNNDRQIGQQEDHWYIVPFIIVAGVSLVFFYMKEFKQQIQVDWVKLLLFAGTVTQISSLCWKSFGFLIYYYTGSDHYFFHIIYLLLHSASESAIISLVILIGFGWTLTYNYGKQFDIYLPVVGCLGLVNVIITMITKIGHSHDRHHVFDNVGGTILIVFRIVIVLIFIGGCLYTYRGVRHNLKKFMVKFTLLGLLYIGSLPLIVLSANFTMQPKNRHQFVFITLEVVKFTTNLVLGYQITSKISQYNKINYKNSSFIPETEKGF